MSLLGNRVAYYNVAEYALAKVLELLAEDGHKDSEAWRQAHATYERLFEARDADLASHGASHEGANAQM